ncbi:MAG: hypothetical protein Kow0090_20460 [Myxococcota bacterium]
MSNDNNCGECHVDIYKLWKTSRHARAATTHLFLSVEEEFKALADTGLPNGKEFCRTCHAPKLAADSKKSSGVNCAFCHSVKGIELGRKPTPFIPGAKDTMYGPLAEAESPAHKTEKSQIFTDSRLCAACHEYSNDAGVLILSTYSEWQTAGFEKEENHCQSCHMPEVAGNMVDPKIKRLGKAVVNLHRFVGGHNAAQLHSAVGAEIVKIGQEDGELVVSFEIENKGAGHSFPTGMPTRKVIAEASIEVSKEKSISEQLVIKRVLGDKEGKPLEEGAKLFHNATKVLSDNRLLAGEKRLFTLRLPVGREKGGMLTLKLIYMDDPSPGKVKPYRNVFFSQSRLISPR